MHNAAASSFPTLQLGEVMRALGGIQGAPYEQLQRICALLEDSLKVAYIWCARQEERVWGCSWEVSSPPKHSPHTHTTTPTSCSSWVAPVSCHGPRPSGAHDFTGACSRACSPLLLFACRHAAAVRLARPITRCTHQQTLVPPHCRGPRVPCLPDFPFGPPPQKPPTRTHTQAHTGPAVLRLPPPRPRPVPPLEPPPLDLLSPRPTPILLALPPTPRAPPAPRPLQHRRRLVDRHHLHAPRGGWAPGTAVPHWHAAVPRRGPEQRRVPRGTPAGT